MKLLDLILDKRCVVRDIWQWSNLDFEQRMNEWSESIVIEVRAANRERSNLTKPGRGDGVLCRVGIDKSWTNCYMTLCHLIKVIRKEGLQTVPGTFTTSAPSSKDVRLRNVGTLVVQSFRLLFFYSLSGFVLINAQKGRSSQARIRIQQIFALGIALIRFKRISIKY